LVILLLWKISTLEKALAMLDKTGLPFCNGVTQKRIYYDYTKGKITDTVPVSMTACMLAMATKFKEDPVAFARESNKKIPCIEAWRWNKINDTIHNYIRGIQFAYDFY